MKNTEEKAVLMNNEATGGGTAAGGDFTAKSRTMSDVAEYIRKMRFKKRVFGGVDEADVFRQMEMLHREYEAVFLKMQLEYELGVAPRREGEGAAGGEEA